MMHVPKHGNLPIQERATGIQPKAQSLVGTFWGLKVIPDIGYSACPLNVREMSIIV